MNWLLPAATNAEGDTSWIAPAFVFAGVVIVAIVNGVASIWRRRQDKKLDTDGTRANKAATEKDSWEETRLARAEATHYYNLYRLFEEMFYAVRNALRALANTIHVHHPEEELDKEIIAALELKPPEDLDKV